MNTPNYIHESVGGWCCPSQIPPAYRNSAILGWVFDWTLPTLALFHFNLEDIQMFSKICSLIKIRGRIGTAVSLFIHIADTVAVGHTCNPFVLIWLHSAVLE